MFKVKAQAKPRTYNGHQFNDYWCAGFHWPGLEPQERDLTEKQLEEMQREQKEGHPIKVISFFEILELDDSNFIPAPVEELAPVTSLESVVLTPVLVTDVIKKPWEI